MIFCSLKCHKLFTILLVSCQKRNFLKFLKFVDATVLTLYCCFFQDLWTFQYKYKNEKCCPQSYAHFLFFDELSIFITLDIRLNRLNIFMNFCDFLAAILNFYENYHHFYMLLRTKNYHNDCIMIFCSLICHPSCTILTSILFKR